MLKGKDMRFTRKSKGPDKEGNRRKTAETGPDPSSMSLLGSAPRAPGKSDENESAVVINIGILQGMLSNLRQGTKAISEADIWNKITGTYYYAVQIKDERRRADSIRKIASEELRFIKEGYLPQEHMSEALEYMREAYDLASSGNHEDVKSHIMTNLKEHGLEGHLKQRV